MDRFDIPRRTLLGPGPSALYPEVIEAIGQPVIGHLDPAFITMMDEIKSLQGHAFQTGTPWNFTISAPASAAMEAAMANLVERGDEVVVCINGVFGGRLAEMAQRMGARVERVEVPWGEPVPPTALREALERCEQPKLAAFVHAETSTGVASDVAALAAVAREFGALSVVDAVTALGGVPLEMDAWGLDVVYSGSQKCLSCVPGVAPLLLSDRAWQVVSERTTPCVSWFLDLKLLSGYWSGGGKRAYHHTAPVNAMYAWHAALSRLRDEGLEACIARHARLSARLGAGLAALGLETVIDPSCALPQLTVVRIPDGIDDADVRNRLLQRHDLEIGAGLGAWAGRMWRLGLMGYSCREEIVDFALAALAT
ncbi:MAG: alanine--glyoxylate aminotransferase family protein, partial [Pseudomonadota bacterium]